MKINKRKQLQYNNSSTFTRISSFNENIIGNDHFPCYWRNVLINKQKKKSLHLFENREGTITCSRMKFFTGQFPSNRSAHFRVYETRKSERESARRRSCFARRAWSTSGTQKSIVCRKVKDWRLIEVEAFFFPPFFFVLPRTFWPK